MNTSSRTLPSKALIETRVVAVLRAPHAEDYTRVIGALANGDVRCIELTLTTPGTFDVLDRVKRLSGPEIDIGVGTITTLEEARRAIEGGADYLVTPVTDPEITRFAVAQNIPIYPGGLSPTELYSSWRDGATAVKVFPASTVGVSYVSNLRGPFPSMQVIPSGGIGLEDAANWIAAGALAVSVGSPLIQDAFHGGSAHQLTQRARELRRRIAEVTP